VTVGSFPAEKWPAAWDLLLVIRLLLLGILYFNTVLGLLMSVLVVRRFREITNALEEFEKYRDDYIARWGEPTTS
jgi:hypothetical protein